VGFHVHGIASLSALAASGLDTPLPGPCRVHDRARQRVRGSFRSRGRRRSRDVAHHVVEPPPLHRRPSRSASSWQRRWPKQQAFQAGRRRAVAVRTCDTACTRSAKGTESKRHEGRWGRTPAGERAASIWPALPQRSKDAGENGSALEIDELVGRCVRWTCRRRWSFATSLPVVSSAGDGARYVRRLRGERRAICPRRALCACSWPTRWTSRHGALSCHQRQPRPRARRRGAPLRGCLRLRGSKEASQCR
jgi:hypothetical protein